MEGDIPAEEIERLRGYGFAIAYRMLGTVADAEDIVQEGMIRLLGAIEDGQRIESRRAYLSTIVTRLAIDELRSARARREQYVGEWLPEPLVDSPAVPGPADRVELDETLSFAFMVVLESLSPEQRAVFLLRDVFDYPYGEVAEVVGKSEPATRQLASRARKAVASRRPRFEPSTEVRDELAERFFAAVIEGEVDDLERVLAADVELHGDGGGKVPAISRALSGAAKVAHALATWGRIGQRVGAKARRVEVNGQPGALILDAEGRLISTFVLEISDGRVQAVHSVVNPDKIRHLGPVADARAIIRGHRGTA